jgi:hypothetical protein
MILRPIWSAFVFSLLLAASGCGSGEPRNNYRVEGTVTLDGEKLPGVTLTFTPTTPFKGQQVIRSRGVTDGKGRFSLTRVDKRTGAVVSQHRVTISPASAGPGAKVPEVYRVDGSTPLFVDVTDEQHDYEVKLTKAARSSGARNPGD